MEDREVLRDHATLRAATYSGEIGPPKANERLLGATIRRLTCEGCPLRGATQSVQLQAVEVMEYLNDSEAPLIDEIEQYAEAERPEENVDTLARCVRTILRGNCERYEENPETGCYIEVKGES